MAGDFAHAVIFLCGMLGWVLLATSLCAYAGYCIVVVVTDTAAGVDSVRWPGDLMVDWIGQSIRFFILFAALLIPIGFVLTAVGKSFQPDDPVARFCILVGAWLWLTFPIALLSSMSAGQPFVIVRAAVLRDLLRLYPTVIVFYVITSAAAYAVAFLWNQALFGQESWMMPFAAVASSAGLLIYARMIGRLGWLIVNSVPARRKRPVGKLKPKLRKQIQVSDPWAAPVVEERKPKPKPKLMPEPIPKKREDEDDEWGPATPYGLNAEPPCRPPELNLIEGTYLLDVKLASVKPAAETSSPPPLPPRFSDDDEENTDPIQLAPVDPADIDTGPVLDVTPSALDMRLTRPDDAPAPTYPLVSGVYTFPFYLTCLRAMLILTISSLALALGLDALIAVYPH
jgi:hypothetical protein